MSTYTRSMRSAPLADDRSAREPWWAWVLMFFSGPVSFLPIPDARTHS